MSSYKDKIEILCKKHKITIHKLETDLGFGNGTIRRWDISEPRAEKIQSVANYFGIPMQNLMEDFSDSSIPSLDDIAYSLYNSLDDLSPEERDRKVREILPELVRRMKE